MLGVLGGGDGREGQHFRMNMDEAEKGRYSSEFRKGDCVFCKPVPTWDMWLRHQEGNLNHRVPNLSKFVCPQVAKKHLSHRTIRDFVNQDNGTTGVANDGWRASFHPLLL